MSLTMIDVNIRKLYDDDGKKLLTIPQYTSLDKIIIDLWSVIVKYMDYYPFIIGIEKPGYRRMTMDEFNVASLKFICYYGKNNGIYFFGKINFGDNYLMIEDKAIILYNYAMKFNVLNHKIKLNRTFDFMDEYHLKYEYIPPSYITNYNAILIPDI